MGRHITSYRIDEEHLYKKLDCMLKRRMNHLEETAKKRPDEYLVELKVFEGICDITKVILGAVIQDCKYESNPPNDENKK